ncbi:MAG: hypothetical protein HOM88_09460 [Hellea sp.]|nr:hypothetical protein [Hellea sp.]
MKYIVYLFIVISAALGYYGIHIGFLIFTAFLSTLFVAPSRRDNLQKAPLNPDYNRFSDGFFLFCGQLLITFTVYILGWFLANLRSSGGMLENTAIALLFILLLGVVVGLIGKRLDR